MSIYVDFQPIGRRGECPEGANLLDCARLLGVGLANLCGGAGSCGRCIVQIMEGQVSPPAEGESDFLSAQQLAEGYRLACRTLPLSDCKVRVPAESLTTPQRTQIEGEDLAVAPEPMVQVYAVTMPPASIEDLRSDTERVAAALAEQHGLDGLVFDLAVVKQLSLLLREGSGIRTHEWKARVAVRDGEVVALLPEAAKPLGVAVDLGTTKVAVYLVDLESGQTLASQGLMNPQIAYGEDVIARMAYTEESPDAAAQMQSLVVDVLNAAMVNLCKQVGAQTDQIVDMVVVANTAMHHLFLGLPVGQLARAPYVPAVGAALDVKARDLGLEIAPGGYLYLLPNIAGYVGADHVAMLLASGVNQAEGVVLALDIGTNTEVCLIDHGRMTSTSCASGPAFEGAHIRHGMRAANGAIERMRLVDGEVEYQTIGDELPVGLCGSGILDTIAELYLAGILDAKGKMGQHEQVRGEGGKSEFLLVSQDGSGNGLSDITFTQKDVRELQLAKGAMRTGINVLLETHGLTASEIDRVIIAGAFGTYIDVGNAMAIGMLPDLPLDRFSQVGNAAGMGAKMALISRAKRAEAQTFAGRIGYVELASAPNFSRTFAKAMYLGQTA